MKNPFQLKLQASLLLAAEVIILVTSAVWEITEHWPIGLYLILFTTGGYAIAKSRRFLALYLVANVLAFGLGSVPNSSLAEAGSTAAFAVTFYLLFRELVRHCFIKRDVARSDRILGGIAGYLLLGFFWHSQTAWAFMLDPEAFLSLRVGAAPNASEMIYWSFVTLTTLGYGDIVPINGVARMITILNATTGVLYVAIFISSLIGFANQMENEAIKKSYEEG